MGYPYSLYLTFLRVLSFWGLYGIKDFEKIKFIFEKSIDLNRIKSRISKECVWVKVRMKLEEVG